MGFSRKKVVDRTMKHLAEGSTRTAIAERLAKLTPVSPAVWGRMSAHQAVCHLSDSFRLPLGRKGASDASGLFHRTLMKWVALRAPTPWPKGVPTRPELEQGVGGTPPGEFSADRAELAGLMEEFAALRHIAAVHPIFGKMTIQKWMRWGFLHMDHHLR